MRLAARYWRPFRDWVLGRDAAADGAVEADEAPQPFASYAEARDAVRPAFVSAAIFSGFINLLMFTGPLFMIQVYDRVLQSGSSATLVGLFALVVILFGFHAFFSFLRSRVLSRAAFALEAGLAPAALRRSSEDPDHAHAMRDLTTMRRFVAGPALPALYDLPWTPLFLAVIVIVHPLLGLLTVAGMAIVVVAALAMARSSKALQAEATAAEEDVQRLGRSLKRERDLIGGLGMARRLQARWVAATHRALGLAQAGGEATEGTSSFSKSFRQLLQSTLLGAGAWLAIGGHISPGMIIAISVISGRALTPVDQVIGHWAVITRARLAHTALKAALSGPQNAEERFPLPAPRGFLSLSDVGVGSGQSGASASDPGAWRLQGIDFTLEPGMGLAVVGPSGSGKSTLARLLTGVSKPDKGEIRLDGARLGQYDPEVLGRHIGWLPQRVEFLPGTVAENIARFETTDDVGDKVIKAARLAGVHELILSLPRGYDTMLSSEPPFSGGQAQRIALARALYGDPTFLVLDEPNAALDASGEMALRNAIVACLLREAIVIVITHKAAITDPLSHVLVLNEGRQMKFGLRETTRARNEVARTQQRLRQALAMNA